MPTAYGVSAMSQTSQAEFVPSIATYSCAMRAGPSLSELVLEKGQGKYDNFRFRGRSTVFSISTAHRNSRARCKAAWVRPFSGGRLKAKSEPETPYHVRISSHPTYSSRTVRNFRAECT